VQVPCSQTVLPAATIDPAMAIDRIQLLALWKLDEMPACEDGMELAREWPRRIYNELMSVYYVIECLGEV